MAFSVREWREMQRKAREGMTLLLPSGLEVKVRAVSSLAEFFRAGGVPDALTPIVADSLNGKTPDVNKIGVEKLLAVETAMLDAVVRAAVVFPRVVESNPQGDDEIGLDEIDTEDKEVLMGLVRLPVRQLESFCKEQTRNVERLRLREALESETEQDAQPQPVVEGTNGAARK